DDARGGEVRARELAQPRSAPGDRSGGDRGAAQDRERKRESAARARDRAGLSSPRCLGMARCAAGALLVGVAALRTQTPATTPPTPAQIRKAALDIMTAARYATFITIGPDGHPQARIVDPLIRGDTLTVW